MKGTIITKGSKYRDLLCQGCTQKVRVGQAAVTHILYLHRPPGTPSFTDDLQVLSGRPQVSGAASALTRIAWHTSCIKPIIDRAPVDEDLAAKLVEEHRQKIMQRLSS